MFGIVNLDKPAGITSRAALSHLHRLVKPAKVGHAGTLDPLATGVLVVCLGPATRLIPDIQQLSKEYTATFLLGRTSDTEDTEGTVHELPDPPRPSSAEVQAVLPRLTGCILQRPPDYSAVKVAGRRAYKLARKQQEVQLEPRPIEIHRIELLSFDYPQMVLAITCGSGTYVRSLGRDIAEALGTGAVMSALRRTAIGPFTIQSACPPESIAPETLAARLLPPLAALPDMPRLTISPEQIELLGRGMFLADPHEGHHARIAAIDADGRLMAILVPHNEGLLRAHPNFIGYYADA